MYYYENIDAILLSFPLVYFQKKDEERTSHLSL